MEIYRPLRAVLFGYECVRLLLIVGFILPAVPFPFVAGEMTFPYLVYAAPNALFPLISLFIWRRFSTHRAYIMLYAAGKCVVLAAALGWILFSRGALFPPLVQDGKGLLTLLSVGGLVIGDAGSVAGGMLLQTNPPRGAGEEARGGSSCG